MRGAILNVRQAMANAGYADCQYTILVQTYSSPIPRGSGFRYPQSGFTRQTIGGCGVWNRDADWANDTVVQTFNNTVRNAAAQTGLRNVRVVDMTNALAGRRLCENSVGLLEEQRRRQLADRGRRRQDRVGQPDPHGHDDLPARTSSRRTATRATGASSRCATACGRRTTAALPRGGTCTIGGLGLTSRGEPVMSFG